MSLHVDHALRCAAAEMEIPTQTSILVLGDTAPRTLMIDEGSLPELPLLLGRCCFRSETELSYLVQGYDGGTLPDPSTNDARATRPLLFGGKLPKVMGVF